MIQVTIRMTGLKNTPRFHRTNEDPMGWIDFWMTGTPYEFDKKKAVTVVQ